MTTYAQGLKRGAEDKMTPKAVLLERLAAERALVAELAAALREARADLVDLNRGPSGNGPAIAKIDATLAKAPQEDL